MLKNMDSRVRWLGSNSRGGQCVTQCKLLDPSVPWLSHLQVGREQHLPPRTAMRMERVRSRKALAQGCSNKALGGCMLGVEEESPCSAPSTPAIPLCLLPQDPPTDPGVSPHPSTRGCPTFWHPLEGSEAPCSKALLGGSENPAL